MPALLILLVAALVAFALWTTLAHRGGRPAGTARRGEGPLGLRGAREITEDRAALEAEDLAQMLAASNARRRRRGQPERTVEQVELLVAGDLRDQRRRREALLADRELDQLLDATNVRRRSRGLPERTREQVRAEFGAAGPGAAESRA